MVSRCCFKFHALRIIITASQSLASHTGLYNLGLRGTLFWRDWGRSWLEEEKGEQTNIKDTREERS